MEGKDGNPLNEVRMMGNSILQNHGVLSADKTIKYNPAKSILKLQVGAEIKLRYYKLWEHFQFGAFGNDHEDRNQLARIARERGSRLLNRTLDGDEILIIGDTPLDIACARAINAKMLSVASGLHSQTHLQAEGPTWAVENLDCVCAEEICR